MLPQIGGLGLEKPKVKVDKGIDSIAEDEEHSEELGLNLTKSQVGIGPQSTRNNDKNQIMFKSRLKAPSTGGIGKGHDRNLTPRGTESSKMSKQKSQ